MRFNKVTFFMMILFLFALLPLLNAEVQTLGTFKQDTCISLIQIANNNYTGCNITSIFSVNESIISDVAMTKRGTFYNYTLCSPYTNQVGYFIVNGICVSSNNLYEVWSYDYYITESGTKLDTSQSLIYIIELIFSFVVVMLCGYATYKLPWKNKRNGQGKVVSVNDLKFVKVGMFFLTYFAIIFLLGILLSISRNYLGLISLTNFFNWFYVLMMSIAVPLIICSIVIGFIIFIQDVAYKKAIKRFNYK